MRALLALAAFLLLPSLASAQASTEPAPADAARDHSCHCKEKMAERAAAPDAEAVMESMRSGEPAQGMKCGMMGGKHGGEAAPAGEAEAPTGHEGHGAAPEATTPDVAPTGHEGHGAAMAPDAHEGHEGHEGHAPTPAAPPEAAAAPPAEGHSCCCKGKMGGRH